MWKGMRRSLWVLLLIAAAAGVASAQELLTISGSVTTRVDGLAVPGALVSVVGTDVTTTTDDVGGYTLQVPVVVRGDRLQLRVDGLGFPPKIIDVATDSATVIADVALTLAFSQEITVGSRVAGDESEKAVPVDVITRSQIASSGYAETAQVIANRSPRRSIFHVRRSPMVPTRSGPQRCADWDPTKCWS